MTFQDLGFVNKLIVLDLIFSSKLIQLNNNIITLTELMVCAKFTIPINRSTV